MMFLIDFYTCFSLFNASTGIFRGPDDLNRARDRNPYSIIKMFLLRRFLERRVDDRTALVNSQSTDSGF